MATKAVLIMEQADMWDLDGTGPSLAHIANYEPFIAKIAALTKDFAKPVLLIDGDSHHYRSDNPLLDNAPCVVETGVGTQTAALCRRQLRHSPVLRGRRVELSSLDGPRQHLSAGVHAPERQSAREQRSDGHELWSVQLGTRHSLNADESRERV